MRIPRDARFYSSVLFTIAFACLVPSQFINAMAGRPNKQLELGPAWWEIARMTHYLGVASLVIIAIGLVVTWMGYVQHLRWTWFVMFIIVWAWAFPLMILPTFGTAVQSLSQWLPVALKEPGLHRDLLKEILVFVLMLAALLLPIKSLVFPGRQINAHT